MPFSNSTVFNFVKQLHDVKQVFLIIKWYAYCVIEELVEMMMAKSNVLHRKEEYADALAFASELIILPNKQMWPTEVEMNNKKIAINLR